MHLCTVVVLRSQSLEFNQIVFSISQAVEGLLDATSGADADLLLRYRECHLLVLKALQDGRAYGPQWCNKQITRSVRTYFISVMPPHYLANKLLT